MPASGGMEGSLFRSTSGQRADQTTSGEGSLERSNWLDTEDTKKKGQASALPLFFWN